MAGSVVNLEAGPTANPTTNAQQAKTPAFVPPFRPSSTPFPQACCLDELGAESDPSPSSNSSSSSFILPCYDDEDDKFEAGHDDDDAPQDGRYAPDDDPLPAPSCATHFNELPMEVHEAIVDHLFGFRIAPTCSTAMRISSLTKSWSTALRHSRRRELADLALVNKKWTYLIQQRLYRHIKLKAVVEDVEAAVVHLACGPHLARHVKHVELWFPVFQPVYGTHCGSNTLTLPTITTTGLTNAAYVLPDNNCSLSDVFRFISFALPEAQVLTLEGGERRKAPKVVHSHDGHGLCPLPSVRTLVTRGQWNLLRDSLDFARLLDALPNLEEWQGSYSKPKSKSYISLSRYLPLLPLHITRLSMCMENDYRREAITPSFFFKVASTTHVCNSLGQLLPRLEHFSFTGRACHQFFDVASRLSDPLTSRLSSVDLIVKNCCPHADSSSSSSATTVTTATTHFPSSGSGIHEMAFIDAFEKMVLSAIRFLERSKRLQYLRIRFVDLDSVLPPLNPYFLLKDRQCTGVWSDAIVAEMARVRPDASFDHLSESFGNIVYSKEGRMVVSPENPHSRISSLKLSNYQALANRMTIQ
ncbi:hypothetical protein L249_7823 [Ophiocordyceps polyrhachis-furcata BCC 54312]|uniref:Uncharacterized protein n=1 Tax=Ophiocordyceps polyrhachis-furcata BCC 54312 TaxID=1330021 RepID=A0A367L0Q4_9HYPO|nr:hypothetical protein L249_7823 [Ophiocordyceps polyrhachis-furcata BCC 54312]